MAQFTATGKLTLSGVTFFIDAEDMKEATEKAKRGEYTEWEIDCAETVDWTMRASSVEHNAG